MALRIAISGSTGLIGTALVEYFTKKGDTVYRLVRKSSQARGNGQTIQWNIESGQIDASALEGMDVVIHLAGANIAAERWNSQYKHIIKETRIEGTHLLSDTLVKLKNPPRLLLTASAVGFYGTHPATKILSEESPIGNDFLAEVCREWENSTKIAQSAGIRVIQMRLGTVLSRKGGALRKMLPVFRLGLGGKLGSGEQVISWITLEEIPFIIDYLIEHSEISGPINVVSPKAISNAEFTKTLGKVIKRPTFFNVPSYAVKLLFGEMGETLLLSGAFVIPKRLQEAGYQFRYSDVETGLKAALN